METYIMVSYLVKQMFWLIKASKIVNITMLVGLNLTLKVHPIQKKNNKAIHCRTFTIFNIVKVFIIYFI